MSTLKRNIFSNLAGGAWVAVLTLAITPIQINLLGVEAFGLIVKWGIEGAAVAYMGLTLISRTHLKRPIMAVEECHAKKKKILGGVQT